METHELEEKIRRESEAMKSQYEMSLEASRKCVETFERLFDVLSKLAEAMRSMASDDDWIHYVKSLRRRKT